MKNRTLNLAGIKAFFICIVICCFCACGNENDECEPIQVNPGDTIVFRYPDIPQNLRYKDANITFYQPHTDSVVIVYNAGCK